MTGREIVRLIMEDNGITNAQFAKRCGVTGATMWDRINSKKVKDIPLSTLNEMLRVLDYKILIVPESTKLPNGGYHVDGVKDKGD